MGIWWDIFSVFWEREIIRTLNLKFLVNEDIEWIFYNNLKNISQRILISINTVLNVFAILLVNIFNAIFRNVKIQDWCITFKTPERGWKVGNKTETFTGTTKAAYRGITIYCLYKIYPLLLMRQKIYPSLLMRQKIYPPLLMRQKIYPPLLMRQKIGSLTF